MSFWDLLDANGQVVGRPAGRKGGGYCVYLHMSEDKRIVYYVGMGVKSRPKDRRGRSAAWQSKFNSMGLHVEIIGTGLSKREALVLEMEKIKEFEETCVNIRKNTCRSALRR